MRKFALGLLLSLCMLAGCGTVVVISDSITPAGPVALDSGQSVTLTAAVAGDSSNAGVTWQLTGAGALSGNTPTTVVYTAPAVTAAGTSTVVATPVNNPLYAAATVVNYSPAPAITSTTLPSGTVGVAYNFTLGSTGGNGALTFSLVSGTLPAGLTFSPAGVLSGTPTVPGSTPLTFRVTDSASTPASSTVTLTLNISGATLSVATAGTPNGVAGTPYNTTLTTTGGVAPFTWSLASGTLPTGLTLSPAGVISGTPSTAGTYSFSVKVVDTEASPQTATRAYTITIYTPLTITTTTLPGGSVKNAYTATLTSSGGTLPVTWSLASGTLPPGLTLSTAGVLSGTPATAGSYTFAISVKDASTPQQTATSTYTVSIVLSTIAITTTSLPQATATSAYSTTLQSSGGNPPVTWSLAAGSTLPTGLTLSSAGVISGTPTTAGTYTFTVQATDSTPATVSQTLTLNVVGLAALTITTTTLPSGNIGTAYSSTLAATGGATPYTWSVSSGTLPPGLSLSPAGVLSGTPLAAGTYTFTIQVKDSQATPATASRQFTVVIGTTLAAGVNNAALNGSYGFLISGFAPGSASGKVYGFAEIGSLTFTGAGVVTGIEDINAATGVQQALAITGTYTLGADNRGLLVLTAGTTTTTFAIAASNVVSSVAQSIALTEFDNATGSGNTASGFARHQTAAAFALATVKNTFAFGLSGESPCNTCATSVKFGPVCAAGLFTADGAGTISAGVEDAAAYATNYPGITLAGAVTAPSTTNGRGTLRLTPTGTTFAAPPTNYTYVIISANELLLLSTDSHATFTLLYGDAQLQQQTTYTTASLTGRSIGYESQANGGDGSALYPTNLNAILYQLTNTASGTATLAADANRAGTFTNTAAAATTYTTATNGRTVFTSGSTGQVVYLYNTGAAFGLDQAGTSTYPASVQYELQTSTQLSGAYAYGMLANPVATTVASGLDLFAQSTGGVNTGINGTLSMTTDSSTVAGTLTLGQTSSLLYLEDATGRNIVNATTSTTPVAILYTITPRRSVSIPATTGTASAVSVLQQ